MEKKLNVVLIMLMCKRRRAYHWLNRFRSIEQGIQATKSILHYYTSFYFYDL